VLEQLRDRAEIRPRPRRCVAHRLRVDGGRDQASVSLASERATS
jgi:hypothetical protein